MKRNDIFTGNVLKDTDGKFTVVLSKSSQDYVLKANTADQKRIIKALKGLSSLEGDIYPLRGQKGVYRLKIYHYRILFKIHNDTVIIEVVDIDTRGDIY